MAGQLGASPFAFNDGWGKSWKLVCWNRRFFALRFRRSDRRNRLILFILWLVLIGWFISGHTFWRDEVRAFSFALSGANMAEMLRITHGEGHPALWYLLLRGAHNLFPFREVLPVA